MQFRIKGAGKLEELERTDIEAAMDAYDRYRATGEHSDFFDKFREAPEYWVRSSRNRKNPVYPTKPLAGFLLDTTELNEGWERNHAASRLYNAGFIIVNRDNEPSHPPEDYDHPYSDADRIRLYALNYFIEPAREQSKSEVSIRAGELDKVMRQDNRFPNICKALESNKFQELAEVPLPTYTEPNPSSSTIFTYTLGPRTEPDNMTETISTSMRSATNLILYGPPGTGKTYQTAWEAVRLCLGEQAATPLKEAGQRKALMGEYRRLVEEGRIEFVTFHQSLSYEEFVEGLRPSTGGDGDEQEREDSEISTGNDEDEKQGESGVNTGFRLKPNDGVFKLICKRARSYQGLQGPSRRLNRSAKVFKVALGDSKKRQDLICFGLNNDLIHVGWGGDLDWSDERFDEPREILTRWRSEKNPEATGHSPHVKAIRSFRAAMQVDDYVVVPDGRDHIRAIGRVTGNYSFVPDAEFCHRREVEWLWRDDRGIEREPFYPTKFIPSPVYELDQLNVNWDKLESIINSVPRDFVLIIDEINRANISKVFGELITLIEPDKRLGMDNEIRVQLPYSKKQFGVPANLHIIGTMNTADRSIALLDTALRRRFTFRELMPDASILNTNVDGINLQKLLTTINQRIEYLFDREHQIGHAYFCDCKTREDVEQTVREKVIPLLAEYFYEDWSKVAVVLGGNGKDKARFLKRNILPAPAGVDSDEIGEEKPRWHVKDTFDFSEFEN